MIKSLNLSLFLCFALLAAFFLTAGSAQAQTFNRPVIVCSTTQVADFARQIVGDRFEIKSILAPGQDPHLYELKPGDAQIVAEADLCLENGWHLEGKDWMRTLAINAGKEQVLVTCADGISAIELDDKGVTFRDPHAWFTPQNAAVYVRNILRGVCSLDPQHQSEYESRAELYLAELRTLHQWIIKQVNAIPANRRVLVTSHDAFNYFSREYGFRAASPTGWSTGQEIGGGVTPQRLQETIDSIKGFGVKAIFVETSVGTKIIEQIAEEAGVSVGGKLYSDSMGPPGSAGETYLGMMRENVVTIVEALK